MRGPAGYRGEHNSVALKEWSVTPAHAPAHRSQAPGSASLGMRQSPRSERLTVPTLGPSGRQERLNWLAKNRLIKTASQRRSSSGALAAWPKRLTIWMPP